VQGDTPIIKQKIENRKQKEHRRALHPSGGVVQRDAPVNMYTYM